MADPWAVRVWLRYGKNLRWNDKTIIELGYRINIVICQCLSVLVTDKSEYFAQLYRIIVKYVTSREPCRKQIWFLKSYVQIKNTKFSGRVEIISQYRKHLAPLYCDQEKHYCLAIEKSTLFVNDLSPIHRVPSYDFLKPSRMSHLQMTLPGDLGSIKQIAWLSIHFRVHGQDFAANKIIR